MMKRNIGQLDILPNELHMGIYQYLTIADLLRLARSCKGAELALKEDGLSHFDRLRAVSGLMGKISAEQDLGRMYRSVKSIQTHLRVVAYRTGKMSVERKAFEVLVHLLIERVFKKIFYLMKCTYFSEDIKFEKIRILRAIQVFPMLSENDQLKIHLEVKKIESEKDAPQNRSSYEQPVRSDAFMGFDYCYLPLMP